jgi:hypothetical protein
MMTVHLDLVPVWSAPPRAKILFFVELILLVFVFGRLSSKREPARVRDVALFILLIAASLILLFLFR